jgi:segregation and condensation protein A
MQDQILDMLLKKDEITWQDILYDLIKSERMSPWDVDISLLSKRYLDIVRKLKETNFFVSGKVILASAILLKIKSNKLLTENIANFDNRLFDQEEEEDYIEGLEDEEQTRLQPRLTIKTPIARKRKVSIQDLVSALEKALEVDTRRKIRRENYETITEALEIPQKKIDLGEKIKEIYGKVISFFNTKKGNLTFTQLVPSNSREDKVLTFVPLLHLENQNKINMSQQKSFGEININLKRKEVKE